MKIRKGKVERRRGKEGEERIERTVEREKGRKIGRTRWGEHEGDG